MKISKLLPLLAFATSIAIISSCDKVDNPSAGKGNGNQKECSLSGFAQKGQLAKGSQVTAFAISSNLIATGESFPANISDDKGAFAISGQTSAPYIELRVDGYYFDELSGKLSSNPLYLEAFVESSDKAANLNLMTTAIKLRVKKLIKEGKSFSDANKQAQEEFLKSFGITTSTSNFEEMDITKGTESDAILLAFACMMQHNRDASGITTLIQEIASDLESSGKISIANVDKITANISTIDVFKVMENLDSYYKEKNISDATIPRFYGFLDERLNKDFVIYETSSHVTPVTPGVERTDFSLTMKILSQIDFDVTSDCDWISIDCEKVLGPAYVVKISAGDNTSDSKRTGHVIFKDKKGNILESKEYSQHEYIAPRCYLYLNFDNETKSSLISDVVVPKVGDKVLVNKELCEVSSIENGYFIVEVSPSMTYSVSWPTENTGFHENPGYVIKTFPAEVTSDASPQYYGELKLFSTSELYTPHQIQMRGCNSILQFSTVNYPQASYAIITGGTEDDFFSGTATYDPTLVRYFNFENKSNQVKITNLDNTDANYLSVMPQILPNGFNIKLYDSSNKVIADKTTSKRIVFEYQKILCANLPK